MSSLLITLQSLVVFLLLLSLIVGVHEWGHFIVARLSRMKVNEFALGFPPRVFGKYWRGTHFALNAIPLGGYVKIAGENDGVDAVPEPGTFRARPIWQRIAVLLAGPAMNFAFAFLALILAYSVGYSYSHQQLSKIPGAKVLSHEVLLVAKQDTSPVKAAPGSSLLGIRAKGESGFAQIENPAWLVTYGKQQQVKGQLEQELLVRGPLKTDAQELEVVTLHATGPALGVLIDSTEVVRLPVDQAARVAGQEVVFIIKDTWGSLSGFVSGVFHAKVDENISGPIGIYQATDAANKTGAGAVFWLIIILSVNLGLLNLMPLIPLDGGRVVLQILERFTGRSMAMKIEHTASIVGASLLALLMLIVTVKDVIKLF